MSSFIQSSLRDGDEQIISGTVFPDVPQYGHLTSDETTLEPLTEQPEVPTVPFDVFAVGSSESSPIPQEQAPAEPLPAQEPMTRAE